MKNRESWRPSKYVYRKGKLIPSRDPKEVAVGSRLSAGLTAAFYDRSLRRYARGRLLDLGCGKVPLFLAYRDHVRDNVCVDWMGAADENPYLDLEWDLAMPLPFKDGEFDTILLSSVLEHIPQPERLWDEMSRILAAEGKIILNAPFFYWLHEQPYDFYRYTEFALRRFVERSGLTLVELESTGGAPHVIADLLSKNIQFIPAIGPGLAILIQYVAGAFVRTGLGGRISGRTRRAFPFGYTLVAEKPASNR